ncbi:hypothetical protein GC089_14490 [Cellulomonas sp. JZ18]|nr:hypothetical protein GC089_14490 [Cellulomonas sp. JZ18]
MGRSAMSSDGRVSIEATRAVVEEYLASERRAETAALAPDVVFRFMATGDEHRGPEAVRAMLRYFYREAFEARTERRRLVVGEGTAVFEGVFVGRHTGEFAGVPATGRDVRVPLAVVYDVDDGAIVEARLYFELPAFLTQVTTTA